MVPLPRSVAAPVIHDHDFRNGRNRWPSKKDLKKAQLFEQVLAGAGFASGRWRSCGGLKVPVEVDGEEPKPVEVTATATANTTRCEEGAPRAPRVEGRPSGLPVCLSTSFEPLRFPPPTVRNPQPTVSIGGESGRAPESGSKANPPPGGLK